MRIICFILCKQFKGQLKSMELWFELHNFTFRSSNCCCCYCPISRDELQFASNNSQIKYKPESIPWSPYVKHFGIISSGKDSVFQKKNFDGSQYNENLMWVIMRNWLNTLRILYKVIFCSHIDFGSILISPCTNETLSMDEFIFRMRVYKKIDKFR